MTKFKPTTDNVIGRHARKAAQIMEERGWVQGMLESYDGRVCLMGAFHRAVSPINATGKLVLAGIFTMRFGQWMKEHYPDAVMTEGSMVYALATVPAWNDGVFKSQEETLAWLNKFADDLDPQR